MDKNILGKNIKYLRTLYGQTQDGLASVLKTTKSVISEYENGRKIPTLETINKISQYYDRTVDEMINARIYELEKIDPTKIVDFGKMDNAFQRILPLVESKKAYENSAFAKGMEIIKEMLDLLGKGEFVKATVISDALECFAEAAVSNVYEAYANMIWCIFFLWSEQYSDLKAMQKFQSRLMSNQIDWSDMLYEIRKNDKKVANKKEIFIKDLNQPLNEFIKELKRTKQWTQLGDYYLALRYVLGMVDTGKSNAMNQEIGIEMMRTCVQNGNRYALDFVNACDDME